MGLTTVHTFAQSTVGYAHLVCSLLPVVIVLGIIAAFATPYFCFFCNETLVLLEERRPLWRPIMTIVGVTPIFLLLASYLRVIFTEPGFVDAAQWQEPPTVVAEAFAVVAPMPTQRVVSQLTREGELRYCARCRIYKPDFVHHCNDCGRCVLRMDHHCVWCANCIGLRNAKYFVLFVFYISVSGFALSLPVLIVYKAERLGVLHGAQSALHHMAILASALGSFVVGVAFGIFFLIHFAMAVAATTSYNVARQRKIEEHANGTKRWWRRFGCNCRDIRVVFGDGGGRLAMLLPIAPSWRSVESLCV